MSRQDKTRAVILRLKAVKDERGISLQKILDLTLANGGNVSMSTVRKVFSDGSEDLNFRYEDTVQPIAAALLGTELESEPVGVMETEAEALRALVRLKNSIIEEYQRKLEAVDRRETEIKEEAQRKVKHLIDEGKTKDKLLDERAEFLRQKNAEIKELKRSKAWLIAYAIFSVLLIVYALATDAVLPLF